MKRLSFLLLAVFSLFFSACSTPTGAPAELPRIAASSAPAQSPAQEAAPTPQPGEETPPPATRLAGAPLPDGETVRQLMRGAHLHWRTLWGDAVGFSYQGDGSTTPISSGRTQVWVQQPLQALALMGAAQGAAQGAPADMWVSDGVYYRYTAMGEDKMLLPEYVTQPEPPPAGAAPDYLPQPPGLLLGIPMSDMIFPIGLAERQGDYKVEGVESIAGREAYLLTWSPAGGPVLSRFWVDTITGVILRQQGFSKADARQLTTDSYFTAIVFDVVLPGDIFNLERAAPGSFSDGYTQINP